MKVISVDDELPVMHQTYDFAGNDTMVSDIVQTNCGPAVLRDGNWESVDWDASELNKSVRPVKFWFYIPTIDIKE